MSKIDRKYGNEQIKTKKKNEKRFVRFNKVKEKKRGICIFGYERNGSGKICKGK